MEYFHFQIPFIWPLSLRNPSERYHRFVLDSNRKSLGTRTYQVLTKCGQGELAHRLVKKYYQRTNKRRFGRQIANLEQRQRILRGTKQRMNDAAAAAANGDDEPVEPVTAENLRPRDEDLPRTPPSAHHHISESKRNFFNVYDFDKLSQFADDPAVEVSN